MKNGLTETITPTLDAMCKSARYFPLNNTGRRRKDPPSQKSVPGAGRLSPFSAGAARYSAAKPITNRRNNISTGAKSARSTFVDINVVPQIRTVTSAEKCPPSVSVPCLPPSLIHSLSFIVAEAAGKFQQRSPAALSAALLPQPNFSVRGRRIW